jgi:hypothetical protein
MTTFYPIDFHRRVDRRWAERMNSVSADAQGSLVLARLVGQQRNQVRETVDPSPKSDAAQSSQRGIITRYDAPNGPTGGP